jgi:hypothetical protein
VEGALNLCYQLMEDEPQTPEVNNGTPLNMGIEETVQNKNMLSTMKLIPRLESLIFPSQCSFYHFN